MSDNLQAAWLFRLKKAITVYEYERGLLYREGKFERLLDPGRYVWWRWERVDVAPVSTRQMSEVVSGQAILTADRIEVRVSLVAQYAITDPVLAVNAVASYSDQLYQDLQLVLRDLVAGRDLESLLDDRSEIASALLGGVKAQALTYGVELRRVGIRDIVLPGSVRSVFMKEVEADREGRAELVRARHEVAAARARANTARIMAENPNIQRMQELEALVKIAGRNGSMVLLPAFADLLSRMGSTPPVPRIPNDSA
jgi:regulator of protease activity HflC (stomatin/prohibitin superfamily)